MPFKYLDLVKVVRFIPEPGKTVILSTDGASEQLAFYIGAVGRVIAKVNGGYKVWFPVPNFADKGQAVEFTESVLKLHRGAVESDYELAHFPGGAKPTRWIGETVPPQLKKEAPLLTREYPVHPDDCFHPGTESETLRGSVEGREEEQKDENRRQNEIVRGIMERDKGADTIP